MRKANFKIHLGKLGITQQQIQQYNIRSNIIEIPPNQVALFKDDKGNMFLNVIGKQLKDIFFQAAMNPGYQGMNVPSGSQMPKDIPPIPLDMTPEEAYTELKMANLGR